jgi:hypothetical protein
MIDKRSFVEAMARVVHNSAISGTLSQLQKPSGKKQDPELVELSQWYNNLDSNGKEMTKAIIRIASTQAVFGFFAVLDGVREFDDSHGEVELRYKNGDHSLQLNSPEGDYLHEIFKEIC